MSIEEEVVEEEADDEPETEERETGEWFEETSVVRLRDAPSDMCRADGEPICSTFEVQNRIEHKYNTLWRHLFCKELRG